MLGSRCGSSCWAHRIVILLLLLLALLCASFLLLLLLLLVCWGSRWLPLALLRRLPLVCWGSRWWLLWHLLLLLALQLVCWGSRWLPLALLLLVKRIASLDQGYVDALAPWLALVHIHRATALPCAVVHLAHCHWQRAGALR
jgi:hypothetical protein